jgi:hypothetical protein
MRSFKHKHNHTHAHMNTHSCTLAHKERKRDGISHEQNAHKNPDHTRLPSYTHTHMSTQKNMRACTPTQPLIHTGIHTNICTPTCMHTHTLRYTPTNHETSQIFTNMHTDARSCARACARTHTLKRTHTHHAPAYAVGATAVHTLLSSYAHTITLLC